MYSLGFCLAWFGGTVLFVVQLPPVPMLVKIAVLTGALLLALVPAVVYAFIPYRVTLSDDGLCVLHSFLREHRVPVDRIDELDWDEDYVFIRHDGGKARVPVEPEFKPFVERLMALNPTIKIADDLRQSLETDGLQV